MLSVLFTWLAVVSLVQAEKFANPVQVNFVSGQSNQSLIKFWQDCTTYAKEGPWRGGPFQGTHDDNILGYITFFGPDDKRAFSSEPLEGESQTCEVWVGSQPTVTVLTYQVAYEGKEGTFTGNSEDADKLVVRCYDVSEYTPPSLFAPSRHSDIPPSNPAMTRAFDKSLIVTFYASPDNLLSPAWWLDGTDYQSGKFNVSGKMPGKPANHADGSIGLGWMEFTSTSKDNRVYGWQSKSHDEATNITSCEFSITADLRVSDISFWVDSPRIEAGRDGVQLADWKAEGLKEDIVNNCHKV